MVGLKAKAWTDKEGVANVFSLADLADQHHVTHDNAKEDAFKVESWEGDDDEVSIKFPRDEASRLCSHRFLADYINRNKPLVCDDCDLEETEDMKQDGVASTGTPLLDTVAKNGKNFTTHEFK